jgi:hypothetical protein
MSILIDMTDKEPSLPEFDLYCNHSCPQHPDAMIREGYGLAGGGFGPYTFCDECARILSKTVEPADEE